MNPPPIPPVAPYSCPNCGLPLQEPVELCPQCGARVKEKTTSGTPYWVRVIGAILLALLILPLGLAGACLLMFSGFGGGANLSPGAIGLVLIGAAVLLGIAATKLLKK